MRNSSFLAEINPKPKTRYLSKLFLSKNVYKDPQNGCPTEFQMYIPEPTPAHPIPNVQLWIRNGAGKVQIRFENPIELATTLRKLADIITSDMCLDEWQRLEDSAAE